ncbi:MAG: hypothetical protein PHS07_03065 [Patescibacteria group bacterium]|nr:hypothetical protein [Patescibacteria group bacterium]
MSEALKKIEQTLSTSQVSPEDQNDLLVFLPILPEGVLEKLNEIFEQEPELIKDFNDNFKAKFEALTGQSDKTWDEIIKQEAQLLDEMPAEEEDNYEEDIYDDLA